MRRKNYIGTGVAQILKNSSSGLKLYQPKEEQCLNHTAIIVKNFEAEEGVRPGRHAIYDHHWLYVHDMKMKMNQSICLL